MASLAETTSKNGCTWYAPLKTALLEYGPSHANVQMEKMNEVILVVALKNNWDTMGRRGIFVTKMIFR
jgi:hypothetical protein